MRKRKKRRSEVPIISLYDENNHRLEQFRTIKNNIGFATPLEKKIKSLAITSAGPSEGKSTVSTNLSVEFTETDKRVLLIDADFRRPTLHNTFCLSNKRGLYSLLMDMEIPISDAIQKTAFNNLDVLTSGIITRNASKFFESEKFSYLLKVFESQYDLVVLDTPPVRGLADTPMIAAKVDGLVIVVQEGKSRKRDFLEMAELLERSNANILGTIYLESFSSNKGYGYYYY